MFKQCLKGHLLCPSCCQSLSQKKKKQGCALQKLTLASDKEASWELGLLTSQPKSSQTTSWSSANLLPRSDLTRANHTLICASLMLAESD